MDIRLADCSAAGRDKVMYLLSSAHTDMLRYEPAADGTGVVAVLQVPREALGDPLVVDVLREAAGVVDEDEGERRAPAAAEATRPRAADTREQGALVAGLHRSHQDLQWYRQQRSGGGIANTSLHKKPSAPPATVVRGEPRTIKWTLKLVDDIFAAQCKAYLSPDTHDACDSFHHFAYNTLIQRFGLESLVESTLSDLMYNAERYYHISTACELFSESIHPDRLSALDVKFLVIARSHVSEHWVADCVSVKASDGNVHTVPRRYVPLRLVPRVVRAVFYRHPHLQYLSGEVSAWLERGRRNPRTPRALLKPNHVNAYEMLKFMLKIYKNEPPPQRTVGVVSAETAGERPGSGGDAKEKPAAKQPRVAQASSAEAVKGVRAPEWVSGVTGRRKEGGPQAPQQAQPQQPPAAAGPARGESQAAPVRRPSMPAVVVMPAAHDAAAGDAPCAEGCRSSVLPDRPSVCDVSLVGCQADGAGCADPASPTHHATAVCSFAHEVPTRGDDAHAAGAAAYATAHREVQPQPQPQPSEDPPPAPPARFEIGGRRGPAVHATPATPKAPPSDTGSTRGAVAPEGMGAVAPAVGEEAPAAGREDVPPPCAVAEDGNSAGDAPLAEAAADDSPVEVIPRARTTDTSVQAARYTVRRGGAAKNEQLKKNLARLESELSQLKELQSKLKICNDSSKKLIHSSASLKQQQEQEQLPHDDFAQNPPQAHDEYDAASRRTTSPLADSPPTPSYDTRHTHDPRQATRGFVEHMFGAPRGGPADEEEVCDAPVPRAAAPVVAQARYGEREPAAVSPPGARAYAAEDGFAGAAGREASVEHTLVERDMDGTVLQKSIYSRQCAVEGHEEMDSVPAELLGEGGLGLPDDHHACSPARPSDADDDSRVSSLLSSAACTSHAIIEGMTHDERCFYNSLTAALKEGHAGAPQDMTFSDDLDFMPAEEGHDWVHATC